MNAAQREEFDAIRAEQRALRAKLQSLETRLDQLARDTEEAGEDAALAALLAREEIAPALITAMPPPLPPVSSAPRLPVSPVPPPPEPIPVPAAARESLEMQIGTTWLVRAGIVLVLTSLAFLGSYLYYHLVPTLGPLAKVALLYLGAGALTGVGAWLERRRFAEESAGLRNYARVVLAGGLAAVYYVTYAAHWNPHLRVVSDPLLAGALLLGWAACMVWVADRRGSELLATFAILLAFYTSAVNEISRFTLVSNLFLAGGAVFLLRRQLWRIFPFVSLLATFGSYGFWRFFHAYIEGSALSGDAPPRPALGSAGFWTESGFLLLYWLLFTWTVFTADERVLPRWRRAGFVTVNNTAFFLLTTWSLLAAYPGSFWKGSLGFGVVLLALAEASRRRLRVQDADTENAYLLQGVLLVTLGFIGYFSGWQLSLVLAVQSAVLLWLAGVRVSRWLLGSSCAVAGVSFVYAISRLNGSGAPGTWNLPALAEGAFLLGNAGWSQRLAGRFDSRVYPRDDGPLDLRPALAQVPAFFGFLGAAVWFWMIERQGSAGVENVLWLAGGAVLLTASIYWLRVRALPWYAQGYLSAAHFHWLRELPAGWNQIALLGATLGLGHWWQWRRTTDTALKHTGRGFAVWDALLAVALLHDWLRRDAPGGDAGWMAGAAALSLVVLGYGLRTGYRALAVAGQLLLAASIWSFVRQWDHPWRGDEAERWLAASPLLAMLAALVIGRRFSPAGRFDQGWPGRLATVYEGVAVGLFLAWVGRYVPEEARFAAWCLGGAAVFALGAVYRVKRWVFLSILPTAAALIAFWFVAQNSGRQHWLGLVGALVLAGQQQFGKRWLKESAAALFPAKAQAALMTMAVFCAWAFVTARMERWQGSAFTVVASWSLFAPLVFAAGWLLHERVYRWLGLVVLAATLGHIVLFDISQLDTLGKAISFFALGLVVLGVGFFYVRFQSKFRDLL